MGYREVTPKPSADELRAYYSEKYYQENKSTYTSSYSTDEKRYFRNKIEQKYRIVSDLRGEAGNRPRVLDVGAGEGWALAFFNELGLECQGIDYSDHGCRNHNPEMCQHLRSGDIFDILKEMIEGKESFDVVWLDNVLEHVLDPEQLLRDLRQLTSSSSVLVIEVPNDFSSVQELLLDEDYISRPFWVVTPDHLSYFNKEGLTALAKCAGWGVERLISDFPIDFNLFNPNTNYIEDPSRGKSCHHARVVIENLIHGISPDGANRLYEALAELGLGRQIVAFLKPA